LIEALKQMEAVASSINESMKVAQRKLEVLKIQYRILGKIEVSRLSIKKREGVVGVVVGGGGGVVVVVGGGGEGGGVSSSERTNVVGVAAAVV